MDLLAFILAISADGITDEQVQTALNAYIAEHPEAVTTVTDGSITKAKLHDDLADEIEQNTTDVGVLKSALNSMTTATASDEGNALKAKTVTNGKVTEWEFGEAGTRETGYINEGMAELLQTILSAGVYSTDQSSNILAISEYVIPKEVDSISAVYSGGSVNAGSSLNDLRNDLVVTVDYSDGTTGTTTAYTLSGTIDIGENTITVTYSGKTDTFTVIGTAAPVEITDDMGWIDGKGLDANGRWYDEGGYANYATSKVIDVSNYTSLRIITTSTAWFQMSVMYHGVEVDGEEHGATIQYPANFWGGSFNTDETADISDMSVLRIFGTGSKVKSETRYFLS